MADQSGPTVRRVNSGVVEAWWPYVASVIATVVYALASNCKFPQPAENLLSASGGAAAVLVGFLATAKAIVLSISGTRIYKALKEGDFTSLFLRYTQEAIVVAICFLVVAMTGFFVIDSVTGPEFWYPPLWFLSGTLSLTLFWRFASILFKMLQWV